MSRLLRMLLLLSVGGNLPSRAAGPVLPHPILFVTQVPQPSDFTTVTALFGNHRGSMESAPRGGDLWIRYPDGELKNLTKAAGFGVEGAQQLAGIAVREPSVHWSGEKAVFSMVAGAPSKRYEANEYYWQLYEITGFTTPTDLPIITKVPNQPANYNNVAPCYGTDDRIVFASDRSRSGERHLWPQLDEYEEAPAVSGLWSLEPTPGISNNVTWWSPDELVSYNGELWELDPVEVRPRARPSRRVARVEAPEQKFFDEEGVELSALEHYLRERNFALIIGRNATTRDAGDFQQPFNLRVPGGTQSLGKSGKVYDVAHLQLYQADLIRGIGLRQNTDTPRAGRRVLAQRMHDSAVDNPPNDDGPPSSVALAMDGSFASFVPARRAMSWQLTGPDGAPVVRERYWVTFQPGEVRTCGSCHGVNTKDQVGRPSPSNSPEALRKLLRHWKNQSGYAHLSVNPGSQQLRLTASTGPARTNVIEVSNDFKVWTPMITNLPNSTGLFPVEGPLVAHSSTRFYRVRVD